jgi:hypothetical protein
VKAWVVVGLEVQFFKEVGVEAMPMIFARYSRETARPTD